MGFSIKTKFIPESKSIQPVKSPAEFKSGNPVDFHGGLSILEWSNTIEVLVRPQFPIELKC
jgi:hypothetical protein